MDRLDCDRMFVAVIESGSFAAAARRLGVSSGQASKLISKLESDLGVQLVKRTTRALSVTEIGQAYHERIKTLLEELDALDVAVRQQSGAPGGRLRLSAPMSFGTICLTPILLDFACAFPDIRLEVSFADRAVSLVDEGFDIAVRIGQPSDSSLIGRKLCDARIILVAAPTYLERQGWPETPADLAQHDCIIDSNFTDPTNWPFADGKGVKTAPISGRLRFSSAETCLAAAKAGFGIANVPSFVAGPALRGGEVRQLLANYETTPHAIHALYPPARHLALKVRVLIDFLSERFQGSPEWDQGW